MALAALATEDDLEAELGRELTDAESARTASLLARASNRVRSAAGGQKFSAITDDVVRRRVFKGRLWLPQRPVTAVTAVQLPDGTDLTFSWAGLSEVQVWLLTPADFVNSPWPQRDRDVVDVTYDHGYAVEDIPEEVRDVVVNVVLRALGVDPTEGGTTGETVEGYAHTQGPVGAAGALGLLPDELLILRPYGARRRVGSIRIG